MKNIDKQLEELQRQLAIRNKILNQLSIQDEDEVSRRETYIESLQLNYSDSEELRAILKFYRNQ